MITTLKDNKNKTTTVNPLITTKTNVVNSSKNNKRNNTQ
jgi:hypothetical protein